MYTINPNVCEEMLHL